MTDYRIKWDGGEKKLQYECADATRHDIKWKTAGAPTLSGGGGDCAEPGHWDDAMDHLEIQDDAEGCCVGNCYGDCTDHACCDALDKDFAVLSISGSDACDGIHKMVQKPGDPFCYWSWIEDGTLNITMEHCTDAGLLIGASAGGDCSDIFGPLVAVMALNKCEGPPDHCYRAGSYTDLNGVVITWAFAIV